MEKQVSSERLEKDKSAPKLFIRREFCCGCTACYAVCPAQAISMLPDLEENLYPVLDKKKCIHCYKCIEVCPMEQVDDWV